MKIVKSVVIFILEYYCVYFFLPVLSATAHLELRICHSLNIAFLIFIWEYGHLVNVNERCTQWEAASGILFREFIGEEAEHPNNVVYRME